MLYRLQQALFKRIYAFLMTYVPSTSQRIWHIPLAQKKKAVLTAESAEIVALEKQTNTNGEGSSRAAYIQSLTTLSNMSAENKHHVHHLVTIIAFAKDALNLSQDLHGKLQTLPGYWSIFASLRPLTLALQETLKTQGISLLKPVDNQRIQVTIQELINALEKIVADLKIRLQTLVSEVKHLTSENQSLRDQLAEKTTQAEEVITLKADNIAFSNRLDQLSQDYEALNQQFAEAMQRTQALMMTLNKSQEENQQLRQINRQLTANQRVLTSTGNHIAGLNLSTHHSQSSSEAAGSLNSIITDAPSLSNAGPLEHRDRETNQRQLVNQVNEQHQSFRRQKGAFWSASSSTPSLVSGMASYALNRPD